MPAALSPPSLDMTVYSSQGVPQPDGEPRVALSPSLSPCVSWHFLPLPPVPLGAAVAPLAAITAAVGCFVVSTAAAAADAARASD